MIRKVFYTLTAALVAVSFGVRPARANEVLAAHGDLLTAVESAGVRVYINPVHCSTTMEGASGFYVSQSRVFVVCQDNSKEPGDLVEMTANDLDTIRHESQHVIQDCIDGIGNNQLETYFPLVTTEEGQVSHHEFVTSVLSQEQIDSITRAYTGMGATSETILLEYEAFAVAHGISADVIAQVVRQVCPVSDID